MVFLRAALPIVQALVVSALLVMAAVAAPSVSYAAPDTALPVLDKKAPRKSKEPPKPVRSVKARPGAYLDGLLDEINARRARVGTQPLVFVASEANEAVAAYLAELTPLLEAQMACFHGDHNPVAPAWDYVAGVGVELVPRGEVLACPDGSGYWTPDAIAEAWLRSPGHFAEIYGDGDANAVACGTYRALRGGEAYTTIACVTYRI